ncbi:hypothetical protein C0993_007551, partial [Termitomyces sp. T159_Od127]
DELFSVILSSGLLCITKKPKQPERPSSSLSESILLRLREAKELRLSSARHAGLAASTYANMTRVENPYSIQVMCSAVALMRADL